MNVEHHHIKTLNNNFFSSQFYVHLFIIICNLKSMCVLVERKCQEGMNTMLMKKGKEVTQTVIHSIQQILLWTDDCQLYRSNQVKYSFTHTQTHTIWCIFLFFSLRQRESLCSRCSGNLSPFWNIFFIARKYDICSVIKMKFPTS